MKFLPDQPPASVSGQTIQGGLCGPFVRSGRPPVDPRRPSEVLVRSAFFYARHRAAWLTHAERVEWQDAVTNGVTVPAKVTSATVPMVVALGDYNPPPLDAMPDFPALTITLGPAAPGTIALTYSHTAPWTQATLMRFSALVPGETYAPRHWTRVLTVQRDSTSLTDAGPWFAAERGPLQVGRWLWAEWWMLDTGVITARTRVGALVT